MAVNENAARDAAISGGLSGSIIGAVTGAIDGKSRAAILRRALIGGLGGATLAGGSIGVGHKILGEPDDESSYTRSGAVGGGLLGGSAGALGAYLLSKGYLGSAGAKNALLRKIRSMSPGAATSTGALSGSAFGAYQGSDEGMQLDFIGNELYRREQEDLQKERLRKLMNGEV